MLAGLEPLLRSPGRPVPEPGEALRRWHEAAHRRILEAADADWDGDSLKRAHYQSSYRIDVAGGEQLRMAGLVDELRKVGNEVMQFVNSGGVALALVRHAARLQGNATMLSGTMTS